MVSTKIFSTVGTTPQAVANALSAYLKTISSDSEIHCYFFMGSAPSHTSAQRTSSNINSVIDAFNLNKKYLNHLKSANVVFHIERLIDIFEQDLIQNVGLIVPKVNDIIQDGDRVIFDITAGRKIMTGSAILSIMILKRMRPNISFEIAYYWLKRFTPENLNKMLYELGFDSYSTIFTPLDQLDEKVRTVLQ